jgi:tetratricopeptide (TPR) repeat protein
MRVTIQPALWAMLFFSASGLHGQGARRFPATTGRYANPAPDIGPLAAIRVQPAMPARMTPSGAMISVHDLTVPAKAAKEMERAMKAFKADDFRSAAEHLQKALQIAPGFVQAHNNLGATYIRLNEYESAIVQLQEAVELAPNLRDPYHNLGIALLLLGRLPEAEVAARRALDIGPQDSSARFTLGRILATEDKNTPEALHLLSESARDIPEARLSLAQVLRRRGLLEPAIAELQTYLRIADAREKEQVGAWLALWTKELAETRSLAAKQKP